MHEADRQSRELAERTAGAISVNAAREVGLAGELLARRVTSGVWWKPTPRVLVLRGSPASFVRDAWIALLDAGDGAAITHDTVNALWKVPGFALYPIHVTRDRSRSARPAPGVVLHRTRVWPTAHRLLLNDLPVVTPTRGLFDIANEKGVHPKRVERAINSAWARRLTSRKLLTAMADEWCERGRRGSAFFRAYLDERSLDWLPPESNLEARFIELIVGAGLPAPVGQRNLGDASGWIGRVDVKDPELPLIGEIQSDLFHTAPLDAAADALREERLTRAGFEVRTFTEFQVWHRPAVVVDGWREARRAAKRGIRRSA